jgi:hypothetical protein
MGMHLDGSLDGCTCDACEMKRRNGRIQALESFVDILDKRLRLLERCTFGTANEHGTAMHPDDWKGGKK